MASTLNSRLLVAAACLVALGGCQTPSGSVPPTVKTMDVNGARLQYADEGRGAPVVFVHGAVSDYRTWDRHRTALAKDNYRAISYTQRYFGTEVWGTDWPPLGVPVHSDDLAAFIRGLNAGPVHLVAWSYGGHTVLNVALKYPELVKSAFVFEPSVSSYVTDPAQRKAIGDDAGATFGAAVQAARAGDDAAAVRHLIDGVGERAGYFESQPLATRNIQLDSARTMPLLLTKQAPPPSISCEQLGQSQPKVAVVRGAGH